jgi:GNAT superfamily N-acetyltransferase
MLNNLKIRHASIKDSNTILSFIKKIAKYENLDNEVIANIDTVEEFIFKKHFAQAIIGEMFNMPIAFAVYFYTFSTFTGKPTLYIEDIYVDEEYRQNGVGSKIFKYLVNLAIKEGCGRLELAVLKWNEPAIKFYKKMGGHCLEEWEIFRFNEETLKQIIKDD